REEASTTLVNDRPAEKPRLFGLLAAVDDYSQVKLLPDYELSPLRFTLKDADDMRSAWMSQKPKLYQDADLLPLSNKSVTRDRLVQELTKLKDRVKPDDRVFLYFSGHGMLVPQGDHEEFVFLCHNFDQTRPAQTGLTATALFEAMAAIPCRK